MKPARDCRDEIHWPMCEAEMILCGLLVTLDCSALGSFRKNGGMRRMGQNTCAVNIGYLEMR